jgi:zinc D-Ala-D-Ala carboxypeptidase
LSKSRSSSPGQRTHPSPTDIPIVQRDRYQPNVTTLTSLRRQRRHLTKGLVFASIVALVALASTALLVFNRPAVTSATDPSPVQVGAADSKLLGHFPYPEAPPEALESVGGSFRLQRAAAKSFQRMVAAARAQGVNLTTISAFRSVAQQQKIFFEVKAQRGQAVSQRAEVSAPPEYSEHHTGYAVDMGDGGVPEANLQTSFDRTAAYRWLKANAARYSFELSFPAGNSQGVSYEPWHWRYVGDSHSLKTFYRARQAPSNS